MHDGVANRLLAASAAGENIPGLEIAWHCIRARRREQATPFLMDGAREAILHGAPDEATRALSSALGQLKGRARDEAALLLAEAHQEMGNWRGALDSLQELSGHDKTDSYISVMAYLLEVKSRRELREYTVDRLAIIACNLTAMARSNRTHPSARIEAALAAISLGGRLLAPQLLRDVSKMLDAFTADAMDPRIRAKLCLAKALYLYHRQGDAEALSKTIAGARLLEEAGAADTTFVRTQIGLGVLDIVRGQYADALVYLEKAFQTSVRLDNAVLVSQAAINLALCHYRLGHAEEQIRWASIAAQFSVMMHPGSHDRVHAAAYCCLGNMSVGNSTAAKQALEQLKAAKEQAEFDWIRQSAVLHEADIYWLMGDKDAAFRSLKTAWKSDSEPFPARFEGRLTRWRTLLFVKEGRTDEIIEVLESLFQQVQRFDKLDQAEILCSIEYVKKETGRFKQETEGLARRVLAQLPISCSIQLSQLGLLLPN
jgi:lipopolysaccharide biosynthesis regulator YciM